MGWTAEQPPGSVEHTRRSSSFGQQAGAYAAHRPGYPDAAVRWALDPVTETSTDDLSALRVLDLAAGTGKLTEVLVRLGADVVAVEPDSEMVAELRRRVPTVTAFTGRAEDIPAPDASFDAVLVGQAFHWFDSERAVPEIARVVRAGGVLALLWNVDDARVAWVEGLTQVTEEHRTFAWWRDTEPLTSEAFAAVSRREFEHRHQQTTDAIVARTATHSNVLVMADDERAQLLARVRGYLRARPETASGAFVLPMLTGVVRATRSTHAPS